jgi:hypothetical protein
MKKDKFAAATLIATTLIVYGLMFLDNKFKLWEMFGSDFSTHTATALRLTIYIYFQTHFLLLKRSVCAVFLLYCALMVYQQYHTPLDIVSTAMVVIVLLVPCYCKEIMSTFSKR